MREEQKVSWNLNGVVNGVGEEYGFWKELVAASGLQIFQGLDSQRRSPVVHDVVDAQDHLQQQIRGDGNARSRKSRGRGRRYGGRRGGGLEEGDATTIGRRLTRVRP